MSLGLGRQPTHAARLLRVKELSDALVEAVEGVRVLANLSWPQECVEAFLQSVRRGAPTLPDPPPPPRPPPEMMLKVRGVLARLDREDPCQAFIAATAESYAAILELLENPGTRRFYEISRAVYGTARDPVPGLGSTHLELADHVLAATAELAEATEYAEVDYCVPAEVIAEYLRTRIREHFSGEQIDVEIDPHLSAKATASGTRVRVRGRTSFSENDAEQLAQHELLVHSATAINGRKQPILTALSLSAPRTTATQEGLATFAEMATGAMDLVRLRRIALRVRAVHLCEQGADFIEVFEFFRSSGQSDAESALSAMRVFRGGAVRGGAPFTKDVVYLQGLSGVAVFLRKAIAIRRPELVRHLFVGRLSASDVIALEEALESGVIAPPTYVPPWARNIRSLAASLSFNDALGRIDLHNVGLCDVLVPGPVSTDGVPIPT